MRTCAAIASSEPTNPRKDLSMSLLSDPIAFRRTVAGASLIAFPLAGLGSAILGSNEGTDTPPAELYTIAAESGTMLASGVVFMLSAVLTVPAAGGILHLLRDRGAALGHLGAAFLLLGAMGHMGYGTWQVMLSQVPHEPDRAAMIAFLDRSAVLTTVLLPLLISIVVGLLLAAIGLRRARRVPLWVPLAVVGLGVVDLAINSVELDSKLVPVLVWTLASIPLSYIGFLVLRTSDAEWARALRPVAADVAPGISSPDETQPVMGSDPGRAPLR